MAKEQLSWSAELALQLLHELVERVKPASTKGVLLRRAIGRLSEHATRRLVGLPWPPNQPEPPTPIRRPVPCPFGEGLPGDPPGPPGETGPAGRSA